MAKKKGINAGQRLMNVWTIVMAVGTFFIINGTGFSQGAFKLTIPLLLCWGLFNVAPNYIIFKKLTIWHKD